MDINKKEQMLSVVAFGCHKKIHKDLSARLEKNHNLHSFFFYEYFLTSPIFSELAENIQVRAFAPFLERVLSRMDFVPKDIKYAELVRNGKINFNNIKFTPKSDRAKEAFWEERVIVKDFTKSAEIGSGLYKKWSKKDANSSTLNIEFEEISNTICGHIRLSTKYLKNKYLIEVGKMVQDANALTKEFILVVYPWLKDPDLKYLNIFCAPIATEKLFYGYILLFYPDLGENNNNSLNTEIKDVLINYINKIYTPLLALFENYWEENMLKDDIQNGIKPAWGKYIFLSDNLKASNDIVERSLLKLWNARQETLAKGDKDKVLDSLIFSKYLIGSPGMVEQIKNIMELHLKSGEFLPAVLVVGGPGSGKDKMSKLIKLFSDNYRFGKEYTINMAMLRPKEITVPLLMGTDLKCSLQDVTGGAKIDKNIIIDGIFLQAKKEFVKNNNCYKPSFIFDELNSLDIESQGSLLRVIENAKIVPLGGLKEESVDFLIIGIMNEDPESITMQRPIEEILKRERIFGGVVGDLLYEYFRGMRRLRDDLYYRIIRDGKIVIPDLRRRREDIPMLFYFFVSNEIEKVIFDIDIEVYEVLMDEALMWPGNFRQLQAIAKETIREANRDAEKQNVHDKLKICGLHVKKSIDKDPSLCKKDTF